MKGLRNTTFAILMAGAIATKAQAACEISNITRFAKEFASAFERDRLQAFDEKHCIDGQVELTYVGSDGDPETATATTFWEIAAFIRMHRSSPDNDGRLFPWLKALPLDRCRGGTCYFRGPAVHVNIQLRELKYERQGSKSVLSGLLFEEG
jgi:hypothetical protein